ncbi:unnamed protein product [Phaeothamnion confervicola]
MAVLPRGLPLIPAPLTQLCAFPACGRTARCGLVGVGVRAAFCREHRKENQVDPDSGDKDKGAASPCQAGDRNGMAAYVCGGVLSAAAADTVAAANAAAAAAVAVASMAPPEEEAGDGDVFDALQWMHGTGLGGLNMSTEHVAAPVGPNDASKCQPDKMLQQPSAAAPHGGDVGGGPHPVPVGMMQQLLPPPLAPGYGFGGRFDSLPASRAPAAPAPGQHGGMTAAAAAEEEEGREGRAGKQKGKGYR